MNCDLPLKNNKCIPFKRFCANLDCSRNAVITVKAFKKWVDIIAMMGYNATQLYMEDTYEVDGHPYFGLGRGRYSKSELKQMDAYAYSKGVELIPSINTLGHLATIFRWPQYEAVHDASDILLCEDERTYEFIDKMFATCAECFTTRAISVSMDEAELLGRGKYLDIHGYQKNIDILKRHMDKVFEISRKYNYEMVLVAGDMPFRLATHSESYTNTEAVVQEDVSGLIPDNMALIYWDYYKRSKEDYTALTRIHQQIKSKDLWYQCAVWSWHSFSPENYYTSQAMRSSIRAAVENSVDNVAVATFGDDGAECARFAVLPALFYASEVAKGIMDEERIKQDFEEMFHIGYDDFLLLDLTQREEGEIYGSHPQRYILYNDPFIGLMDLTIPDHTRADHEELMKLLSPLCSHPEWGYLFRTMHDLCAVTAAKCDIGIRIRAAYETGDRPKLVELAGELRRIRELVETFYESFCKQWMRENKPHGFDVSDVRLGGVVNRLNHCAERLEDYIRGDIDRIEELEEVLLDMRTPASADYGVRKYMNYWDRNARQYCDIVTANMLFKPRTC